MNYEDMTDFEINSAVTSIINNCASWEVNDAEFYHCGIDGSAYYSVPILDYCNSPAESWPIIIENSIIVEPRKNKTSLAYVKGDAPYEHKNPLRAAMIVFLIMQEEL